jgi:urease accessory protein
VFDERPQRFDHRLSKLRLMQLADSALPIGTASHSFGLETLAAEGELTVGQLGVFLQDYLQEAGPVEGVFCRAAYHLGATNGSANFAPAWLELNAKLSALKPARESREASATLGRRLLHLAVSVESRPILRNAATVSAENGGDVHHCIAFGLVCGALNINEEEMVVAYLQQLVASLVSACQRLMPLGQNLAQQILWELKPTLVEISERSASESIDTVCCFTPLVEMASMRHPTLATRLFIS